MTISFQILTSSLFNAKKRRSWVVSIYASVPGQNMRPETGLPWLKFMVIFVNLSRQMLGYLETGHKNLLPRIFELIIHANTIVDVV